jgi:hypothetical protein
MWVTAMSAAHLVVFFGAPFRAYWRRDSALLVRLPLPGETLYRVSVWRAVRAATRVSIACAIGALAIGLFYSWEIYARHLLLVVLAWLATALFAPAVALAAGTTVASAKTEALMKSFGGEFAAPRNTWLGALPGIAAAGVALELIAGASWAAGGSPPGGHPVWFVLPGVAVPLLSAFWAHVRAHALMPSALREVAALDQARLAHVDLSKPSGLERTWFALVLSAAPRLVAEKDATLLRRRYPVPYFLLPLGLVALTIACFSGGNDLLAWAGTILVALAAYSVLMAARMVASPTEHFRLIASLPLAERDVLRSKRLHATLRLLVLSAVGGGLMVWRSQDATSAIALSSAVLAFSLGATWLVVRTS